MNTITTMDNYSPFDTVRLARQMARELGCEEAVEILFIENDDSRFNRVKMAIDTLGHYHVRRVNTAEEVTAELAGRNADICMFSSADTLAPWIKEMCRKNKTPVLVLNNDRDNYDVLPETNSFNEEGVIQYFNGKLNTIHADWCNMDAALQKVLHCCFVVAH